MRLSKGEVNWQDYWQVLRDKRNRAKLLHYVSTLREQLEQLAEGEVLKDFQGVYESVLKVHLNEYSEKIEAIAAKLAVSDQDTEPCDELSLGTEINEFPSASNKSSPSSEGMKRRYAPEILDSVDDSNTAISLKLDAATQTRIKKHRKLQEGLTDEIVSLAQKLKERSLMMNLSIKNIEKILDSTERTLEHSLATTRHANSHTTDVYSQSMKTTCFTWLLIFATTGIFMMVVLLIRVT